MPFRPKKILNAIRDFLTEKPWRPPTHTSQAGLMLTHARRSKYTPHVGAKQQAKIRAASERNAVAHLYSALAKSTLMTPTQDSQQ